MPSNLERLTGGSPPAAPPVRAVSRRTARALEHLRERTVVRQADVEAEGFVASVQIAELDAATREAMTGQALLARYRDVLAAGDPQVAEDLRFLLEVGRIGAGEILADLVDTYCREGRR